MTVCHIIIKKLIKVISLIKKIVVAGSRDFKNYNVAKEYIDFCISEIRRTNTLIFMSGSCKGADFLGEMYAKENGFEIKKYPAEWQKYGKAAGPIRNEKMAKDADYIICFWNGQSKGTMSMIEYAEKYNKPIKIKKI